MYCAVEPLEEADLRLLAREGADQPHAGVVLLRLRGDIGEAGLDALEALMNPAAEVLHQDAGQRHRRQRHQRQIGADAQHEEQREDAEEDRVGAVHQRRAQQHAHRIQVVRHARHDVAGAVALIKARVLLLQLAEQVVAQVELDLARDADQNPALRVEKDALDQRDGRPAGRRRSGSARAWFPCSIRLMAMPRTPRKLHRDDVRADARQRAPHVSPAVAAHVTEERGQIAKHDSIVREGRWRAGGFPAWADRVPKCEFPIPTAPYAGENREKPARRSSAARLCR